MYGTFERRFAAGWLSKLARGLVELAYPRYCQLCDSRDCPDATPFICSRCLEGVRKIEGPACDRCGLPFDGFAVGECPHCRGMDWSFERAASGVRLRGPAREAIHRFKYRREVFWMELIGVWLRVAAARIDLSGTDLVAPVPLHRRREREREYNQSALLARHLARTLRLPVAEKLLRRLRDTPSQTGLEREDRFRNQEGAFGVRDASAAAKRTIVLVDDVWTTGATTEECAKILLQAGAKKVLVLTAARG
jgi:ComF family protein